MEPETEVVVISRKSSLGNEQYLPKTRKTVCEEFSAWYEKWVLKDKVATLYEVAKKMGVQAHLVEKWAYLLATPNNRNTHKLKLFLTEMEKYPVPESFTYLREPRLRTIIDVRRKLADHLETYEGHGSPRDLVSRLTVEYPDTIGIFTVPAILQWWRGDTIPAVSNADKIKSFLNQAKRDYSAQQREIAMEFETELVEQEVIKFTPETLPTRQEFKAWCADHKKAYKTITNFLYSVAEAHPEYSFVQLYGWYSHNTALNSETANNVKVVMSFPDPPKKVTSIRGGKVTKHKKGVKNCADLITEYKAWVDEHAKGYYGRETFFKAFDKQIGGKPSWRTLKNWYYRSSTWYKRSTIAEIKRVMAEYPVVIEKDDEGSSVVVPSIILRKPSKDVPHPSDPSVVKAARRSLDEAMKKPRVHLKENFLDSLGIKPLEEPTNLCVKCGNKMPAYDSYWCEISTTYTMYDASGKHYDYKSGARKLVCGRCAQHIISSVAD